MAKGKSSLKTWLSKFFGSSGRVQIIEDPKDPRDNYLRSIFGDKNTTFLSDIHSYANDRKGEIAEYKEMLKDGVTLAAINLIVEDATQLDNDMNMAAWITSMDNPEFAKSMNTFLMDNFHINDIIYSIAYNVVAFGECFIKTHYEDTEGYLKYFHLGDYFMLEDIAKVAHIYKYGVPLGYIRNLTADNDGKNNNMSSMYIKDQILPEKSYIHFCNDKGNKEKLNDVNDGLYIAYGSSFLEGAKYYYKQRQLLDDLILLSRLTRSSKYNLFKVEVGAATSQDTARMIREVKTAVQQRQEVSVSNQVFSSRNSPLLSGGNVYFPVRNGLGGVEVQSVTDDPNVSSLKDIDYFSGNYYSALGVPQSFLGNTGELPSGLGDSTLTQLDIRYARMIKRVQRVLKNGIRDLIIWKCLIDNTLPPEFDVNMTHILTAEDDRRSKIITDATQRMRDLFDILSQVDPDILKKADKQKLLYFVLDNMGGDADLVNIFKDTYLEQPSDGDKESENSEDSEDSGESENSGDNTFGEDEEPMSGGSSESPFDMDDSDMELSSTLEDDDDEEAPDMPEV